MSRLLEDPETPRDPARTQFELAGWIDTAPFEDLVGITIESAAEGTAVLSLPFLLRLAQGGGVLHGGVLATLADTAVAMAIKSLLPPGTRFATTEMAGRFLAPVSAGRVTARATVDGPRGRDFWGSATVTDESGRAVFSFTSVFRVARGQGFGE